MASSTSLSPGRLSSLRTACLEEIIFVLLLLLACLGDATAEVFQT
jgi:hypothetical protein